MQKSAIGSNLRSGFSRSMLLVAMLGLWPQQSNAKPGMLSSEGGAHTFAAVFQDLCLRGDFSSAHAQAVFARHGWRGTILQRSTAAAPFTTWAFSFGEVQVGYRIIGGVNFRSSNCGLVLKASHAPARPDLLKALEAVLAPARLHQRKSDSSGFSYIARLTDKGDEQAQVTFSGDRVPLSRRGSIKLGPGVLINYSYAKGPHARDLAGR